MALGKTIVTPKGMANFWVISYTFRDAFGKTAQTQLRGYESREQCDSNAACLEQYNYTVPSNIFNDYFGLDIVKADGICDLSQFYKFIKQFDTRFSDAEDLIY